MGSHYKQTKVNSWNEWDPLKHVIVGVADGCCIPPPEPASEPKIPFESDMRGLSGPRPPETVARANELLNNFVSILEKRGIIVDRPTPEVSLGGWMNIMKKTSYLSWIL